MRLKHIGIIATLALTASLNAQELKQEITLDKDFVPVEKKATKKNTLPDATPITTTGNSKISFSEWAVPTKLNADFPVMMPYGYRTSHMFSTKRGYVDFGLGTQLNMTANVGYRVIDEANSSLSLWTQHSSTWNGKNTSPVMKGLSDVLKQKFNDNIFGADFKQAFDKGDLDLGAWIRLDNFNYYGTKPLTPTIEGLVLYDPASWNYINEKDQTFIAFNAHGTWDSKATISDHDISYNISAGYDYAGYNRSVFQQYKGIKEHSLNLRGLATFMIDDDMSFGADARFDYVNRNTPSTTADSLPIKRDYGVITLAPFYNYDNGKVNAELGVIVNFSMGDGAAIRLAPNALVSANVTSGLTLYANATGGKTLNTTAKMAQENRYFDPMGHYKNSYTAVDAEAGAKIGPFKGFSMKLFAGYGIFKHDLNSFIPYSFENGIVPDDIETSYLNTFINPTNATAAIYLVDLNTQGVKVG
ncbi:MAG: ADP-ribosylglycohydrolase family protein, partial [Muribaculaceae bacterium]|nr:ADP-ribosylglycohydrolase family protein [Muribaculaceae bacterium]